ncbi:anion transporter [Bacteroidales bacterium 6E]|nr:anion transporter [Bacteroidales bacterium 6E]
MKLKELVSFIITPLIIVGILFFWDLDPNNRAITHAFCITLLMAVWWITEAVPLAVTSLLPVALFPLFGVLDSKTVSSAYFNDVIFLFMGGFLVALAMEKWNLHQRIALKILSMTGVKPANILAGFMVASFFLSMWISNTATAMMMLPIAMSIIKQLDEIMNGGKASRFSIGLLLGIAYSASTGGMATLVGTPPNLSFVRIFEIYFPNAESITFSQWLIFALPVSLIISFAIWLILYYSFRPRKSEWIQIPRNIFSSQMKSMGRFSYEEKWVLSIFSILAFLWIFRVDLVFGNFLVPGWSRFFPQSSYINDGTIAILMSIVLFIIPSKRATREKLLDWHTAGKLPWQILLLFGGGFALATGLKESGLSLWFGERLTHVATLHPMLIILIISLFITFLTELTSNTATTEMILPILAGLSITSGIHPLFLMVPATLSASMAFMMPVATPPNAIVFGSGRITVGQMARTGFIINIIGAIIITLMMYFYGNMMFGIN